MSERFDNETGPDGLAGTSQLDKKAAEDKKADRRHTLFIALLTGIVGIVGTLIGSAAQAEYAREAQQAGIEEEHKQEDRENRKDAYHSFLKDAQTASRAAEKFYSCFYYDDTRPGPCDTLAADLTSAHISLWLTLDTKVYIYGSSHAYERAKDMRDTIPQIVETGWDKNYYAIAPAAYDATLIYRARRELLEVICAELPATPRANC